MAQHGVDDDELSAVYEALDANENDGIDYSEFLAAIVKVSCVRWPEEEEEG